jgi:hypothetical protein
MIRKHFSVKTRRAWAAVSDSVNFGSLNRFNILILESRITFRSVAQYAGGGEFHLR